MGVSRGSLHWATYPQTVRTPPHTRSHPTPADAGGCGCGGAGRSDPIPHPTSSSACARPPQAPGALARPLPSARKGTSRRRAGRGRRGPGEGGGGPSHPTPQLSPERGLRRPSRWAGDPLAVRSRAGSSRRSPACSPGAGGAPRSAAEPAGPAGTCACRAPPSSPRGGRAAPRPPRFAHAAAKVSAGRAAEGTRPAPAPPGAADTCRGPRTGWVLPSPTSRLAQIGSFAAPRWLWLLAAKLLWFGIRSFFPKRLSPGSRRRAWLDSPAHSLHCVRAGSSLAPAGPSPPGSRGRSWRPGCPPTDPARRVLAPCPAPDFLSRLQSQGGAPVPGGFGAGLGLGLGPSGPWCWERGEMRDSA